MKDARRDALRVVAYRDVCCVGRLLVPSVCCSGGVEGHEPLRRSQGGDPFDPAQVVLLCAGHHRWVHDHPDMARRVGLIRAGRRSDR